MSEEMSFDDFQALYGPWRPLPPAEVASLFSGSGVQWWIGGGWAVDAAARVTRVHEDVDVVVLRHEFSDVRRRLSEFHLWEAESGALKPLAADEALREEVSQVWIRRDAYSPWLVDLLLTPTDGEDWLYKRDQRIRRPLASIGFVGDDGVNYLQPEIVLLFKAKLKRSKDEIDFEVLLPHLSAQGREFLAQALGDSEPGHPWLARLDR
jgi:Aminoglycoside-2''-adenylyltransferase